MSPDPSYSAYLWHQPIFAFVRAYSQDRPDALTLSLLIPVVLILAYLSWRYVEAPFRDKRRISVRGLVAIFLPLSVIFVAVGAWLHVTHGVPKRLSATVADGSRSSAYNSSAFRFKTDAFVTEKPIKLLVVGDSYGRDVVNMVVETLGTDDIEIVYRDDIACVAGNWLARRADVIFVSRRAELDTACMRKALAWARENARQLFYLDTKTFGTNINWVMQLDERANLDNSPDPEGVAFSQWLASNVPAENFVRIMDRITVDGRVPVTNANGELLSDDTRHLTRAGAIYVGRKLFGSGLLRGVLTPREAAEP